MCACVGVYSSDVNFTRDLGTKLSVFVFLFVIQSQKSLLSALCHFYNADELQHDEAHSPTYHHSQMDIQRFVRTYIAKDGQIYDMCECIACKRMSVKVMRVVKNK